jgi:endonuclease/exonuclease/phosphatase family metal-dependent hydrolase
MIMLASYNMHKGVGSDGLRRPERILDVLNELGAAIVALQEVDRRTGTRAAALPADLIARHSDYRAVPLARRPESMGWHGNAILVHRDVTILAQGHIELPTLEPRGAVFADVRFNGISLRVVGMHLDLSGLWRRRQARAILSALDDSPVLPTVMMGDLNEWRRASGCIRDFGARFHLAPTAHSFPAQRPVARLDRIMADATLMITECGVHRSLRARHASDHLPIWARIAPA